MTYFGTKDYLIEVRRGNIPGASVVGKFGEGTVGTSLAPVTNSGVYSTPTAATALEFVSSDANDTSAGSGAREITVIGLDASWAEVTQTVTTNGTAAVALGTDLIRLYRWYVSSSGTYATASAGSHVGTLTIRESGAGATWSTIGITPLPMGQSLIAAYTVPVACTARLIGLQITPDSNKPADVIFFKRPMADDVVAPFSGALRVASKFIGISSPVMRNLSAPGSPLVGPCDVGFMAKVASGTGDVAAEFELLQIDD